jgi:hypothetical protein
MEQECLASGDAASKGVRGGLDRVVLEIEGARLEGQRVAQWVRDLELEAQALLVAGWELDLPTKAVLELRGQGEAEMPTPLPAGDRHDMEHGRILRRVPQHHVTGQYGHPLVLETLLDAQVRSRGIKLERQRGSNAEGSRKLLTLDRRQLALIVD